MINRRKGRSGCFVSDNSLGMSRSVETAGVRVPRTVLSFPCALLLASKEDISCITNASSSRAVVSLLACA